MTHQTVSLGKYWKLFPTTLKRGFPARLFKFDVIKYLPEMFIIFILSYKTGESVVFFF